jgi:cytochrome c553
MNRCSWMGIACAIVAASLPLAAQQPSPPPAFARPNLSESGARALAAGCAPCHGTNGRPVAGSTVPRLAGRAKEEIVDLMAQFRDDKRHATLMPQIAKGYSDAEIGAMADYFSKQAR